MPHCSNTRAQRSSEDNPGSLTYEETVDVIAYMLPVNGMPTGDTELRPDPQSLSRAVIQQKP